MCAYSATRRDSGTPRVHIFDVVRGCVTHRVFWVEPDETEHYSYLKIENGEVVYGDLDTCRVRFLEPPKKPKKEADVFDDYNILTWDIETYRDPEGMQVPFAIGVR
jgi:hypothetical protein